MRKLFLLLLIFFTITLFIQNSCFSAPAKKTGIRTVEIQTKDETILTGKLSIPEIASVNNKVPIVLLLHSLGGNHSVYADIIKRLTNSGFATLAVDSRGHGLSTTKLNGKKTYWQNYSNKTYLNYPNDIDTILTFLKENYVSIDANRIAIVGADINANATVISAVKNTETIKTIVLLSPSLNFKSLNISSKLMNYPNPTLILVSENDIAHYNDARILSKYPLGKTKLITFKTGGTGDNLLKTNYEADGIVLNWIKENL